MRHGTTFTVAVALGVALEAAMGLGTGLPRVSAAEKPNSKKRAAIERPARERGNADRKAASAASEAGNRFASELFAVLSKTSGNVFLSPHSIHVALAMTWAGARGETAQEMAKVLHLDAGEASTAHASFEALLAELNAGSKAGDEVAYQLSVANALWGQKDHPFEAPYLALVKAHYDGALESLDFEGALEAARARINTWVGEKTQEKIPELIPKGILSPDTTLVLTNAIHFKSGWAEPFKPEATKESPFHLADGKSVTVPLMRQVDRFGYFEGEGFQAVELPYAGRKLSMVVLLPRTPDGLPALEKKLSVANVKAWFDGSKSRSVDVALPRFTTRSRFSLVKAMQALGMTKAFNRDADFSGMTRDGPLVISEILHEAFVAVDEEGTEAAAATAVIMMRAAAVEPEEPVVFRADHPFLYAIRHRDTGAILFLGRMANAGAEGGAAVK